MSLSIILKEHWHDKRMLWSLSRNDFKARFASTYLGGIWAFVQPLCTMFIFWFVFQMGLRSADVGGVPFILWYAPAYLVWTFFSDAVSGMTSSVKEYAYLVRKVNFRVSLIPTVKLVSTAFVHLGFILFLVVMNLCYGRPLSVYNLQVVYYFLCAIVLSWGIGVFAAAVTPFVGDMSSIVGVILQIGFWATPIVWNPASMSAGVQTILKLNPMFYICEGYRDAFIHHVWFWQNGWINVYFWAFTALFLIAGTHVFKKLSPEFSDVL